MSRPRSAIAAIVEPGGIAPGDGCGPGRRLASRSHVRVRRFRRGRDFLRTGWPRIDRRDRHRRRWCRGSTSGRGERKCEQRHRDSCSHRNSLSRGHSPTTAAAAATTISSKRSGWDSTPAVHPPRTLGRAAWRGFARSGRAGWIRRQRTARPKRRGRGRSPARPRQGSRRPGRHRTCLRWLAVHFATPSAVADGPGRSACRRSSMTAVERRFACGDVAMRDQLQGLIGAGLLGEDASLPRAVRTSRCPRFGSPRCRLPPTGWPRRSIRSPATPLPPRPRVPC